MEFKKKNGFVAFVLSFIPGVAEMYMGLIKSGMSMMVAFVLLVSIDRILGFRGVECLGFAVWLFAIIHAWKTRKLYNDTAGKIEDRSFLAELIEGKYLIEFAMMLIISGALVTYNEIGYVVHCYNTGCTISIVFKQEIMDTITIVLLFIFGIALFISEKKNGNKIFDFKRKIGMEVRDGI